MAIDQYDFTDHDYRDFRELVGRHTGIELGENKKELIYGRLSRRLRELGLSSFEEYRHKLNHDNTVEIKNLSNLITTNLTSFFREKHHFDYLKNQAFPELMEKKHHSRKIRIWSAGCSTGEEPYSIAMTARESIQNFERWDFKILATDLDTNVIAKAQSGIYSRDKLAGMQSDQLKQWFQQKHEGNHEMFKVSPKLSSLITFAHLNLIGTWPMTRPFDIIFCRNVVIYFNTQTQTHLFERFSDQLHPDGLLFVGHSETLRKITNKFNLIEKTIYRKS